MLTKQTAVWPRCQPGLDLSDFIAGNKNIKDNAQGKTENTKGHLHSSGDDSHYSKEYHDEYEYIDLITELLISANVTSRQVIDACLIEILVI